ncbi:helix-hairpin-helix domain-containing protein [bacterium]|nr:helix-hairpin-helix domain-containing protein [bacterium]
MKNWSERVIRFFSNFGLTRQETHFVLLLLVITLIGSLVPPKRVTDSGEEELAKFKVASGQHDSLVDSITALAVKDSLQLVWKNRADTIRMILASGATAETIDSLIAESGDSPVRTININEANVQELASLPRVGPKLAARIVDYRNLHGPFTSVNDLQRVKGIGKKMFDKIKPFVTVN